MQKKKIVIASILKPVNDTRMYEKMGLSLAETNKYEVNIIGFSTKSTPSHPHIAFYPIFDFKRLSIERVFAPWKFLKYVRKIQPEVLLINTHELLLPGVLYTLFSKANLLYDVRENYYRNILYTDAFPLVLRPFIAGWVRFKEYLSHTFITHYFLAEKGYEEEFSFARKKYTVLENKYHPVGRTSVPDRSSDGVKLIFTGTLAASTGVFYAIALAKSLHALDSSVTLNIIGYTPLPDVVNKIKESIDKLDYITLIGGNTLVPHQYVIDKILEANFGIIGYPYNKSTFNTTPTKLYEYLANRLPMIIQHHPKWKQICEENNAGIVIDFEHYSASDLLSSMKNQEYYSDHQMQEFLWASQERKMLNIINS